MIDRRKAFAVIPALAGLVLPTQVHAVSTAEIDIGVDRTLRAFVRQFRGSQELLDRAAAALVFPTVIKAGMGIGGEYGEGALLVQGRNEGYYNTVSASIGFQLGAQARSIIIVFMTHEAFDGFRRISGWKVGVDGSIALITIGVGGSIDTSKIASPIVGFIFDGKGLMYNLTLEGSKITRISR